MDTDGLVLWSDLPVSPVGKNIDEIINSDDVLHFMECVKSVAASGKKEYCSYSVADNVLLATMERVSTSRVRIIDVNVTGIKKISKALKLFYSAKRS